METINIGIFGLDDDPDDLEMIERALKKAGADNYKLFPIEEQLIDALTEDIHLIILDHKLTKRTGLDVLKLIKDKNPASYVIAYNGIIDPHIIIQYIKLKVDDWVTKGYDNQPELIESIKEGLKIAAHRVKLYERISQKLGEPADELRNY